MLVAERVAAHLRRTVEARRGFLLDLGAEIGPKFPALRRNSRAADGGCPGRRDRQLPAGGSLMLRINWPSRCWLNDLSGAAARHRAGARRLRCRGNAATSRRRNGIPDRKYCIATAAPGQTRLGADPGIAGSVAGPWAREAHRVRRAYGCALRRGGGRATGRVTSGVDGRHVGGLVGVGRRAGIAAGELARFFHRRPANDPPTIPPGFAGDRRSIVDDLLMRSWTVNLNMSASSDCRPSTWLNLMGPQLGCR